jgi:spore coat-associated protein N
MSRMHALVARPKRTLAALATVLVAVGITAASGADFTATSANPNTTFATGTLKILNSLEGQALFSATDMRPGDAPRTGSVTIKNNGSLSGHFTLKRSAPVDSDTANPLSEKLNVTVKDGAATVYNGTLAGMGTLDLGTWSGGESHTYDFSVSVDTSADNAYQGDNSKTTFTWDAA